MSLRRRVWLHFLLGTEVSHNPTSRSQVYIDTAPSNSIIFISLCHSLIYALSLEKKANWLSFLWHCLWLSTGERRWRTEDGSTSSTTITIIIVKEKVSPRHTWEGLSCCLSMEEGWTIFSHGSDRISEQMGCSLDDSWRAHWPLPSTGKSDIWLLSFGC